ncbi:hypothetical protein BCR44DRAFT_43898 [Catenaria anguillulae PL171]|uniref:Secreted protein n=1 Tax=Catenaria anguillulae PL171 TaxID=765915 RepID=A0A1Y2I3P9_9FUNG|nr:hypothetical protein BCR44DRAFT_43898 [Catenaria anguillulae PL171]
MPRPSSECWSPLLSLFLSALIATFLSRVGTYCNNVLQGKAFEQCKLCRPHAQWASGTSQELGTSESIGHN